MADLSNIPKSAIGRENISDCTGQLEKDVAALNLKKPDGTQFTLANLITSLREEVGWKTSSLSFRGKWTIPKIDDKLLASFPVDFQKNYHYVWSRVDAIRQERTDAQFEKSQQRLASLPGTGGWSDATQRRAGP